MDLARLSRLPALITSASTTLGTSHRQGQGFQWFKLLDTPAPDRPQQLPMVLFLRLLSRFATLGASVDWQPIRHVTDRDTH